MRKIEIYNRYNGKSKEITLSELREKIAERRRVSLINELGEDKVTVHTTSDSNPQIATRYSSFRIRQFNHSTAISVFNKGGVLTASLK